jgi:hypothetical protein
MGNEFIKFQLSKNSQEILKRPKAFTLLAQIALKAKRTNSLSVDYLKFGEALITDPQQCGLTQQEYRTAKKQLNKMGLVTFKTTNRGTIAKLLNTCVFDIYPDLPNKQTTIKQQTANKQKPNRSKGKSPAKKKKQQAKSTKKRTRKGLK